MLIHNANHNFGHRKKSYKSHLVGYNLYLHGYFSYLKDRENGPWCLTTDPNVKWEYCDVPVCPPPATDNGGDIICKLTGTGQTYRGTLNVTKDGLACQRWDTQHPHQHTRNNDVMFPDDTVSDAENYCRNPDDEPFGPWCYTEDPNVRWNYCEIDDCSGMYSS